MSPRYTKVDNACECLCNLIICFILFIFIGILIPIAFIQYACVMDRTVYSNYQINIYARQLGYLAINILLGCSTHCIQRYIMWKIRFFLFSIERIQRKVCLGKMKVVSHGKFMLDNYIY